MQQLIQLRSANQSTYTQQSVTLPWPEVAFPQCCLCFLLICILHASFIFFKKMFLYRYAFCLTAHLHNQVVVLDLIDYLQIRVSCHVGAGYWTQHLELLLLTEISPALYESSLKSKYVVGIQLCSLWSTMCIVAFSKMRDILSHVCWMSIMCSICITLLIKKQRYYRGQGGQFCK